MASKPILLEEPIDLGKLATGESFTFQANFDENIVDEEDLSDDNYGSDHVGSLENLQLEDEDLYEYDPKEFSEIAKIMTKVDKDGKVLKRVFREGTGDSITINHKVTYHYKAFLEYNVLPFDSTFDRRKPEVSRAQEVLYGLSVALTSMRVREKAQFIIHPEWAYGAGLIKRIPADSVVLFEVEVLNAVPITKNVGDDNDIDEEDCRDFKKNYDKALKLCGEAKHLFAVEKKVKPAIHNYNKAISLLSRATLEDEDQQNNYVTLLLRLHTNLAIAHNRVGHWKKTCLKAKDVYQLCNTFYRDVDSKVYYNHAKALFELNELKRADETLRKAARQDYECMVQDKDIINLYKRIQDAMVKQKAAEKNMAQLMMAGKGIKK